MVTLIIVNAQNDFITGTRSFKGVSSILEPIKKFIKSHKSEIDKIVFACDWHPYNHCSFKKYGGDLQYHCVQFTPGACIEPKLLKFIQSLNLNYEVDLKGQCEEFDEEGAFSEIEFVTDELGQRYYFDSLITVDANTDFVICGIGEDVIFTINNLINGGIIPKIYLRGTIIQGDSLYQFINSHHLEKMTL